MKLCAAPARKDKDFGRSRSLISGLPRAGVRLRASCPGARPPFLFPVKRMDEDIVFALITGVVILVPLAGLTLRFALKPIVDSVARLMEVRNGTAAVDLVDKRVALLEQEVQYLRSELRQLSDRTDFYDRLIERSSVTPLAREK